MGLSAKVLATFARWTQCALCWTDGWTENWLDGSASLARKPRHAETVKASCEAASQVVQCRLSRLCLLHPQLRPCAGPTSSMYMADQHNAAAALPLPMCCCCCTAVLSLTSSCCDCWWWCIAVILAWCRWCATTATALLCSESHSFAGGVSFNCCAPFPSRRAINYITA